MYDPNLGRFLSEDPIDLAGGDVNLYRFAGNDPVNFADPNGLSQSGHPLAGGFGGNVTTSSSIPGGAFTSGGSRPQGYSTLDGPQIGSSSVVDEFGPNAHVINTNIAPFTVAPVAPATATRAAGSVPSIGPSAVSVAQAAGIVPGPSAAASNGARRDGLGSWSGWFADNANYYQEQRGWYAPLSILSGTLTGVAALFDAVPGAIKQAATDSRQEIARSAAASNDPIMSAAGSFATALSHVGEAFAQFGNALGASSPLLAIGGVWPAAASALSSKPLVGLISATGLVGSTVDVVANYNAGSLSGSDAFFVGASALGLQYALSPTESGVQIISRVAQEQVDQGLPHLGQYMSAQAQQAYVDNPASGSRFLGTAVHNATNGALKDVYGPRFRYQNLGPDFLDTSTQSYIELTTPSQIDAHAARGGPYTNVEYATYVLPEFP